MPRRARPNHRLPKQRGLLDDTIVLWAGEFGRLPVSQIGQSKGRACGRDHNMRAGSLWLTGGGFKKGYTYGSTDEVGYQAVEKQLSMPDLMATIAHQMGIDHERLTHWHAGREETMTDSVVSNAFVHHEILA
jgi:hypothetical protein